jgi:type I restriction enzyme S subunit
MIGELKPYPEYKDSGLAWLPSMPATWTTRRSKYLFREVDTRSTTGTETRLSMSQRHGLIPSKQVEEKRLTPETNIGAKICEPGDLVLNRLKAHLGVLAVAPARGVVSPDYTVLRPIGTTNHHYFCAVYRSPYCGQELRRRAKGIVEGFWRLYTDDFYDIQVPVPPPEDQAAIVRFLAWACARLDRAIRAKRRVIALLHEQKQAIVHRAVTRGLDPDVALKPSGVPWLGDIPRTWRVARLKQGITSIEQGWSPQCDSQPAGVGEWGVLKVGCVNRDTFAPSQNKKLPSRLAPAADLEVRDGDILMSRANTQKLVGLAAVVEGPSTRLLLCDKLFRFRPKDGWFDPQYLVLAIRAQPSRAQIEASTGGASDSMQNIGQAVAKNLWIAVPPLDQQADIAQYVLRETNPQTEALLRLEREIDLLREYRARLIADVVTGQLDVREAAARLPEEATPEGGDDAAELGDDTDAELPEEEDAIS